jgi:hypothetical protein
MSEVHRKQLEEAQDRLELLTIEMQGISTPEEARVIQAKIQAEVERMTQAAEAWQREELARHGLSEPPRSGKVIVALTPQQQQMVLAQTGLEMVEIALPGEAAPWLRAMPAALPPQLDRIILQEAQRRVARREARDALRAQLDELAASESEEVRAQVEALRLDPDFADGVLHEEI